MERKPLPPSLLRAFSPLDGLRSENLYALSRKAQLRTISGGRLLFRAGEIDKQTYFLLSGTIELLAEGRSVIALRGGSAQARAPLVPANPRRYSARVTSDRAELLVMDSDMLDIVLTWDQTGVYEVSAIEDSPGNDWMTALLQSKALHRIPPANLQAVFMRMQRMEYAAGDVVVRQGDQGDYFYVIVSGKCVVTRETSNAREGVKLAELGMGDSFGEEALIAQTERNATVSMLTAGTLMRLAKDDFDVLLKEPLLRWVDPVQAQRIIANGGRWLDVRLPSEFETGALPDAVNVPLYVIRMKLNALGRNTPYVTYCDSTRRSSAAAYILSERGFDAAVLIGGLSAAAEAVRR